MQLQNGHKSTTNFGKEEEETFNATELLNAARSASVKTWRHLVC